MFTILSEKMIAIDPNYVFSYPKKDRRGIKTFLDIQINNKFARTYNSEVKKQIDTLTKSKEKLEKNIDILKNYNDMIDTLENRGSIEYGQLLAEAVARVKGDRTDITDSDILEYFISDDIILLDSDVAALKELIKEQEDKVKEVTTDVISLNKYVSGNIEKIKAREEELKF